MKKKIILFLIILVCSIFSINIIKADSGWDTNYDIGGSSGYSGGYSGGSSGGSGGYSSSTYSSSSSSSSSTVKPKKKVEKTVSDSMITLNDDGNYVYVLKLVDEEFYNSLYSDGVDKEYNKSVYNDRIILYDKNDEIVIYRSQHPWAYEQLRGDANPPSRSIFVYSDRVEVGENGITTIVYKSENEELYNQLKEEKERNDKKIILYLFVVCGVFFLITLILVIYLFIKTRGNKYDIRKYDHIKEDEKPLEPENSLEKQILEKHNLKEEDIVKDLYEAYLRVQNAWSNFDYETLKEELSNELYNTYVNDLEALKIKEQQNIMYGFQFVKGYVKSIEERNNEIKSMDIYLKVRLHDFVVDKDMNVVRGNKEYLFEVGYIISIIMETQDKVINCPNCGAEIDFTNEGECSYCKTKIIKPANKFVICQKKAVDQKRS